jgi:hypothetical protein
MLGVLLGSFSALFATWDWMMGESQRQMPLASGLRRKKTKSSEGGVRNRGDRTI